MNAVARRRTADAFRSNDGAEHASLIAEDVVWQVPGSHAMACDIHGGAALLAWLNDLRTKGIWLTERDVFGSDQHVCALSTMGATRENVDVETGVVSIFVYRHGLQLERAGLRLALTKATRSRPTRCTATRRRSSRQPVNPSTRRVAVSLLGSDQAAGDS